MSRAAGFTFAGLGYGAVLFLLAFLCAGFGHGSILPFAIFGAPFSLIPVPGLYFFAAPFVWALYGFLLGGRRGRWPLTVLFLHLAGVSVVLILAFGSGSAERQWEYLGKSAFHVPGALWGGLAIYGVGQLVAWILALRLKAPS